MLPIGKVLFWIGPWIIAIVVNARYFACSEPYMIKRKDSSEEEEEDDNI